MSGYREHSFDPSAGGDYGPPLRPYNWVQWTGVAFGLVGIAIDLVYLAGRGGIGPKLLDSPSIGIALPLLGAALISSRRRPLTPEQTARKRRQAWVAIAIALAACAAGAAAILYFKGA